MFRCFFEDGSRFAIRINVHPLAPYSLTMNCSAPADSFGTSAWQLSAPYAPGFGEPPQIDKTNNGFISTLPYQKYQFIRSMTAMESHKHYEKGRTFIDILIRQKCIEIFKAQERKKVYYIVLGITALAAGAISTDFNSIQQKCCLLGIALLVISIPIIFDIKPNYSYPG